jgi:predicted permease
MSSDSWDIRKVGIWFLLLAFAFVAIVLPLLSTDAPPAVTGVTFTLILILEILFALSLNAQLLACAAYHLLIRPRSPPNR